MLIEHILGTKGALLYADFGLLSAVVASVYATVKVTVVKATGRAPTGKGWRWADAALELMQNLPGAINKGVVAAGHAPLLPHPDVVAAEARADRAEAVSNARSPLRRPTLPGVPPPHVEE
jgi:hypothetical protein